MCKLVAIAKSICKMIVLAWLMDEEWVYQKVVDGISDMEIEARSVVLVCDKNCEWRTHEWLGVSLKSLSLFSSMDHCIDTSGLPIDRIADMIMQHRSGGR